MKVAFDTSVLVAGSIVQHAYHLRARIWLDAARQRTIEAVATTHAFGELWSTLTALPIEPRIDPGDADAVVSRFAEHVRPTSLSWALYRSAIRRCTERRLRSGAIYDALHVVAGERAGADVLLTFDTAHFLRLVAEPGPRVLAPPDPPALLGT